MEALDSTLYLSNDDLFLFARGEWYRSYEKMGAHPARTDDGTKGYHFAVWAPDVQSVHVIGEFNGWDETATPLTQTETGGVWEGPRSPKPRPAASGRALSRASRASASTST